MNGHYEIGEIVLNDWELVRELGQGSYGKVYEAHRKELGDTIKSAIKIITIPKSQTEIAAARNMHPDKESMATYFHSYVERVIKECVMMSQLGESGYVVNYKDHKAILHEDGVSWDILIRMEVLTPFPNYTIAHKMQQSDVIRLGIDICHALELCEEHHIVHRDVKPDNIFVSEQDNFKLGDFGVARILEGTTDATKAGSPMYMAPEVYNQQPYNVKADIYSLGIVMYEQLNDGRAPFLPPSSEQMLASDRDNAVFSRISGAQIPPLKTDNKRLAEVVLKACEFYPENRYENASQMREALEGLLQDVLYLEKGGSAELQREDGDERGNVSSPALGYTCAETDGTQLSADMKQAKEAPDSTMRAFSGYHDSPEQVDWVENEEGAPGITKTMTAWRPGDSISAAPKSEKENNVETNSPRAPKKKIVIGVTACAVLLFVIALAVSSGGKKGTTTITERNEPNGESVPTSTGTLDVETAGEALNWSDWMDHLPADINGENSAIQCKLQYRSTPLYRIEDGNPQEEGYIILRTEYGEGYGDYKWEVSPNMEDESIEVSSDNVQYQYWREKRIELPTHGIYVIPDPVYEKYWTSTWQGTPIATRYGVRPRRRIDICYKTDDWGEFADELLLPNDETVVNTRMQYRYAKVENGQIITSSSIENFPTFNVDYTGRFADVDDAAAWYGAKNSDALRTVSELGILLPDSNLRFHPDDPITVGQTIRAAVMIQRIYQGREALLGENNGQYEVYADYAIENGIIARGEFVDLSKAVTRQELAYILSGALPAEELQERFTIGKISDMDSRFYDYALELAKAGVVNLGNGNTFRPDDTASRAEVASMIDRLIYPEHRVGRSS